MRKILAGGTFDNLHKGHRQFIRKAFDIAGDSGKVFLCLTSDEMVRKKPLSGKIQSYEKRKENLISFLSSSGFQHDRYDIIRIDDAFSEGIKPELTHIVVSPETRNNAEKINGMRTRKGVKPLEIVCLEWVLGDDGEPVSDIRVRKGEMDSEGRVF